MQGTYPEELVITGKVQFRNIWGSNDVTKSQGMVGNWDAQDDKQQRERENDDRQRVS